MGLGPTGLASAIWPGSLQVGFANPVRTVRAHRGVADHLFPERRPFGLFATRQGLARFGATSIETMDALRLPAFDGYAVDDFQAALQREGALRLEAGGRGHAFVCGTVRGRRPCPASAVR